MKDHQMKKLQMAFSLQNTKRGVAMLLCNIFFGKLDRYSPIHAKKLTCKENSKDIVGMWLKNQVCI